MKTISTPVRGACLLVLILAGGAFSQTLPPHPRLLTTPSQLAAIQSRIAVSGSRAALAYNALASSASLSSGITLATQAQWWVKRDLRKMVEVAFRYALTGNSSYASSARNVMLQACSVLTPTGTVAPYRVATYPSAIAATFDLIYPTLSASQIATVVSHLEAWINALKNGSAGPGGYNQYAASTDNHSFAWSGGIAFTLLGIWEHSSLPNKLGQFQANMNRLNSGWRDVFSPDGSYDEWVGYANYGGLWSVRAAIASENCGLGDYLTGTNVLKSPHWFSAMLMGNAFEWMGDSMPSHRGLHIDPILYYLVNRTQDAEALWGINRIYALQPIDIDSSSHAFSANLCVVQYYPDSFQPQQPQVLSAFFRDNLNEGSPSSNKLQNHFSVGLGGHALLHNSPDSSQTQLSVLYMIRDEWGNHSHEDDGHVGISLGAGAQFWDKGYANGDLWSQSTDHNIVTASGNGSFGGSNHFSPPSPNGRFLGTKEASMFSPTFDYVRGDHHHMWMMQKADRSVIMIKDPTAPYVIVGSVVNRNGSVTTYSENFQGSSAASGEGTAASPMLVSGGGSTLKSVYLSPSSVSIQAGPPQTTYTGTFYKNSIVASGTEVAFIGIHSGVAPASTAPLNQPGPVTRGGVATFNGFSDTVMLRTGAGLLQDAQSSSNGRFAWLRESGGQLSEWCVAEATTFAHQGDVLLATSTPMTLAVRQGRVDIGVDQNMDPADVQATLYVPFPVSSVEINGQGMSFTQSGTLLTLGASFGTTQLSTEDRFYPFSASSFGDALPSSAAVILGGRFTSLNGWASLRLKGGSTFSGRPLLVSGDALMLPGAQGTEVQLRFVDALTDQDLFSVQMGLSTSQVPFMRTVINNSILQSVVPPLADGGSLMRFTSIYDPVLGSVELLDPLGGSLFTSTVPSFSGSFYVRLNTSNFASVDNVGLFDSEEDGSTPEGVVYWVLPSGLGGVALAAPALTAATGASPYLGNGPVGSFGTYLWYVVSGMHEVGFKLFLPPGSPPPATVRTACFQSLSPCSIPTPGVAQGFWLQLLSGQELLGLVTYPVPQ